MLKKYLTKFTVDILPSVAATVIGAYIVNHYIVSKPDPAAQVPSVVSTADPKAAPEAAKVDSKASDVKASDAKASDAKTPDAKTPDASTAAINNRAPGVKAKGVSERAILEKTAAEKDLPKTSPTSRRKPLLSRPRHGGIRLRRVKRLSPGPFLLPPRLSCRWYRRLPRLCRLKPRALRKSAATPTILRARRSNVCAVRTMVRRDRRKPLARRIRLAFRKQPATQMHPVSCWRPRSGRCRRRSWSPHPRVKTVDSTTGSLEMKPPLIPAPYGTKIPVARRRRLISRHPRSTCAPKRRGR